MCNSVLLLLALSLPLLPSLVSLAPSADKPAGLSGFQNRKTSEFLFFLFKQEQKQLSNSLKSLQMCRHRFLMYKRAALIITTRTCKKTGPIIPNINTDCTKMSMIKDNSGFFYHYKKVWIHDRPIASTTRVYAAWVSLSRPTTVRTIPSLKPTLNLPSWLPPKNTEHKQHSKLI